MKSCGCGQVVGKLCFTQLVKLCCGGGVVYPHTTTTYYHNSFSFAGGLFKTTTRPDLVKEMIDANRTDLSSCSEVSRSINSRPAHVDGEPPEPDLRKWVWGTEHRDQGWKDQVLSCNIFYHSTTNGER